MQKKFFQVPDIEDFYETVIFEPLQARMRSEEEEDHADLTNTRVAPTMGAQNLIILVGGQKLVPDLEAARRRLLDYVWALESARVRIAFNLPATYPNFQAQLVGPNPFGAPGRITFLYVKEELGF